MSTCELSEKRVVSQIPVKRKRTLVTSTFVTSVPRWNRAIEMHNNSHHCLETMFIVLDTKLHCTFNLKAADQQMNYRRQSDFIGEILL